MPDMPKEENKTAEAVAQPAPANAGGSIDATVKADNNTPKVVPTLDATKVTPATGAMAPKANQQPQPNTTPVKAAAVNPLDNMYYLIAFEPANFPNYKYHAKCKLCAWEGRLPTEEAAVSHIKDHVRSVHGVKSI